MAAFDRVKSGIESIDTILDSIRIGDNVVWQVSCLEEYQYFVTPFVRERKKTGKEIIYMRFAKDDPLVEPQDQVKIYKLNPEEGFESFTLQVHKIIEKEGREAFYVFDSLSQLQVSWASDLMMGNFFRVTCPYLFELDTVAYFPLIRGRHSFDAIARIRDTTQLLLDIYREKDAWYFHPLKVWNRYSQNMFRPHHKAGNSGAFNVITDGFENSRYYRIVDEQGIYLMDQNLDHWERFFAKAKMEYQEGILTEETQRQMCQIMMSRDSKMAELVFQHFEAKDYFQIKDRMIGSGTIGGKACGMLLARKIVQTSLPESYEYMEPHDSFYIGSDVFYTYIVENQGWKIRIKQRTKEGYYQYGEELKQLLLKGEFPRNIKERFINLLDYFGQSPMILRSSSLQEDSFGNAFAGKYESVFCVNSGSLEERLEKLEQAIRVVYASTMDRSALEYRRQRGLEDRDEQMAILVQRVSGSFFGAYFMPGAAGVGYSFSAYRWNQSMEQEAGMLRLVMGLGTRAVDRTEGDYPRLVSLDQPESSAYSDAAKKHRYSQHKVDVLNVETNALETVDLETILPHTPRWYQNIVLENDSDAEQILRARGDYREIRFASCQNITGKRPLMQYLKQMMKVLEEQYQYPVDIEYTINFDKNGSFVVNLLQCRPLQTTQKGKNIEIPSFAEEDIYFELDHASMGSSREEAVDVVIIVDPGAYYHCPYHEKSKIAHTIGEINHYYFGKNKNLLLMVPGRIGTSSPELGVPVTFSDISQMRGICEVAYSKAGYQPELSYGSHIFQDLVETDILYSAIFEKEGTRIFRPDFFKKYENKLPEIVPEKAHWKDIIAVYSMEDTDLHLVFDMMKEKTICGKRSD